VKIKFSILVDEARALVDQASPINQLFCIKFTSLPNGRRLDTQHNDTWITTLSTTTKNTILSMKDTHQHRFEKNN
jgi:hypothetical protein